MSEIYFTPKKYLNPNIRQINGPFNVVRLEGTVHGINKVIYLFMDAHMDISDQTECLNVFSLDLHQYFANTFYRLNESSKIYDFFFEIYPTRIPLVDYEDEFMLKKQKYIWQVYKFFKKIFKYNKKKNKVEISNLFKNIRLHYLDLRDYFESHIMGKIRTINGLTNDITNNGLSVDILEDIIGTLKNVKEDLVNIINILKNANIDTNRKTIIIKEKDRDITEETTLKYLAYKFRYRYNHPDIKNILNNQLDKLLKNFIEYIKFIDSATKEIEKYNIVFVQKSS